MTKNLVTMNLDELAKVTQSIDTHNEREFSKLQKKLKVAVNQYNCVVNQNKSLQKESSTYFGVIELISNYLKTVNVDMTTSEEMKEHIESLITGVLEDE